MLGTKALSNQLWLLSRLKETHLFREHSNHGREQKKRVLKAQRRCIGSLRELVEFSIVKGAGRQL